MLVGIATWYRDGYNFGSNLQAFALSQFLKSNNINAELINYYCCGVKGKIKKLIKPIYFFMKNKKFYATTKKIERWENTYLTESKKIRDIKQLKNYSSTLDYYICGSDQIWNCVNMHPYYYAQFVELNKRIAYAPSIGRNDIPEDKRNQFKDYIEGISKLSVREEKGAQIIKKYTNKDAQVVVDPVLLLSSNQWIKYLGLNKNNNKNKYVFCYLLTENDSYLDVVRKYASENKCNIVKPSANLNSRNEMETSMDPSEFVESILNAEVVFTDSYHGLLFSMIFNKQVCLFKRFTDDDPRCQNSRIYEIVNAYELENIIYNGDLQLAKVDYDIVNKSMLTKIEKSKKFLLNSIGIDYENNECR